MKTLIESLLDDEDVQLDKLDDIKRVGFRYDVDPTGGVYIYKYNGFINAFDWRKMSNYLKKNKLLQNFFDSDNKPSYTLNRKFDLLMSYIVSLEFTKDIYNNKNEFSKFITDKLKEYTKTKVEFKCPPHKSFDIVFYIDINGDNVGWFYLNEK